MNKLSVGVALAAAVFFTGSVEAANAIWNGPAGLGGNGNWTDALRWSGGIVPDNGAETYDVFIDDGKIANSTVTLNTSVTINTLTIDPGDQLIFNNTQTLTLATGTSTNDGTIQINAINTATGLILQNTGTLAGFGTIALSNNPFNHILTDGSTVTQSAGHTIEGAGQLLGNTGDMINNGIIRQTGTNQLVIDTLATFTNNGTLEATGSGGIKLLEGTYDLGTSTLTVKTGSKLDLEQKVVIRDSRLVTEGNGVVNVDASEDAAPAINAVQFQNVVSDASVLQGNTEDSHISGTFTNNGTWSLAAINTNTDMTFAGGVSIAGTGTIALSNNPFNRILTDGATLTQGANHSIEGAGQLLANTGDMINNGLIRQTGTNQLVIDTLATFTNNGTLEATGSGGIKLLEGTYDLGTSTLTVKTGSKLDLEEKVVIRDSRLVTEGNGVVNVNSQEDGSLNAVQFQNLVSDASVLQGNTEDSHISGTFTNNGTWSLAAINTNTDITFAGPVSIAGTGTIALSNNPFNRILTDGATLTQGANHSIEGAGQLLANTGDMINNGLIRQTGTNQLVIDTLATFTNNGTLEAIGSGGIKLLEGTYDLGTSTLTVKTGSKLDLEEKVVIRDSRLVTEGNGVVNVNSQEDGSLNAVQFLNLVSDASVQQGNTEDSHISGTFTNNSTWSLAAINTNTDITFAGPVSIAGTGTIALSNNPFNRILTDGSTLTQGASHSIEGAGQLLANTGDMVNNGIIRQTGTNQLVIDTLATFTNNGTLEATGSGGIKLLEGTYELGTATLTVNAGSKLDLEEKVVIRDSRLVTHGNGVVNVNASEDAAPAINAVQFQNVVSDASVMQGNTEDSHISGTFTNNGSWSLAAINTNTDITFAGGVSIAGTGEIALSNNSFNRLIATGGELVNGSGHTIRGAGQLLGDDFRNQGHLLVDASNGVTASSNAFTNEGTVEITNKLTRTGEYVQTAGLTIVDGELEANLVTLSGGVLAGSGLIDADVVNTGGLINPGNSPGTLNIDGTFGQSAGTLLIEIAGNGPGLFDVLDISGNASLGGLIGVSLLGYTPTAGEFFDILFAPQISGNFTNAAAFSADNFIWMAEVLVNPIGDDFVRLSAVAPVPLPAAVWMLLGALGMLGVTRRGQANAARRKFVD